MPRRAPGEGSICKRKDGRFQVSLQVAGVRKTVYARTEREARQRLEELKRQAALYGALPHPGSRTVKDLLEAWLSLNAPRWRPRTLEDWRRVCERHLIPAMGHIRLSRLSPAQLAHFLTALEEKERHRTALKVFRALNSACRMAVRWGWLNANPCERIPPPRYRPKRRELWSLDELRRFLEGTCSHWLHPLWVFLAATGCRIGEALGLTWADVEWASGKVRIRWSLQFANGSWHLQEPKTRAGVRELLLPAEAMEALARQRQQQERWREKAGETWADALGLVFTGRDGRPLWRKSIVRAMRQACQRLGLPPLSPHGLRHLHISLLLEAGLPLTQVARRAGHSSPYVTAMLYAHVIEPEDGRAAEAIAKAMRGA